MVNRPVVRPQKKPGHVWRLDDFSGGLGGFEYEPGRYYWGDHIWPTQPGYLGGVALASGDSRTGIASNEKTVKELEIGTDAWRLTSTTLYRSTNGTGNWAEKGANGTGWPAGTPNPTDFIAFNVSGGNPVIAVCFGTGTKWYFTVDNGANWTISGMTGNAAYANYFVVASHAGTAPKVWYVRNPNELYSTADLTGAASSGPSYIGDYLNDEFNSIVEDDTGVLLMGKRRSLYSIDSLGNTYTVAGPYNYVATRSLGTYAGYPTQPANANFECHVTFEGRIYYVVDDGRKIIEYDHGQVTEGIQPSAWGAALLLRLPIIGMTVYNRWLLVAITDASSTLLSSTTWPGGSALIGNTGALLAYNGGVTSSAGSTFLLAGRRRGDGSWIWHGSIATLGYIMRTMNYSQSAGLLMLHKAAAEGGFGLTMPKEGLEGLDNTNQLIELGVFRGERPGALLRPKHFRAGLLNTASSLHNTIYYRLASDELTTAYTSLNDYSNAAIALTGTDFPPYARSTRGLRLLMTSDAAHNAAPLSWAEVEYDQ